MRSNEPIVGIGTKLPIGVVTAIKSNGVEVLTVEGVKLFSFSHIEGLVL
jgi:hypothetical protein